MARVSGHNSGSAAHAMLLLAVGVALACVAAGLSRGLWLSNLHNALLGVAFTAVGAYVLVQRPGHTEGRLFLATGVVEAMMFLGRQIGHSPGGGPGTATSWESWWGWLGVWPVAVSLGLVTLSVIFFPDGRLPSPGWRSVVIAVVVVCAGCALVSAIWPVEYAAVRVTTPHPVSSSAPARVTTAWSVVAHPAYAALQILWIVAIAIRWRSSSSLVRRQLTWVIGACAVSVLALVVGLVGWRTPVPGLLAASLVPVAAGWAIVSGQREATYEALSWLSRASDLDDLPTGIARAAAVAMGRTSGQLWMGGAGGLRLLGIWPDTPGPDGAVTLSELEQTGVTRPIRKGGSVVGALRVDGPANLELGTADEQVLDDLAGQAAWVIDHVSLADIVAHQRAGGQLEQFTPREREVLDLMAQGCSNAAICERLHLSVKTVEPVVSAIFAKLGLSSDPNRNRRVLAVLAYLRDQPQEADARAP